MASKVKGWTTAKTLSQAFDHIAGWAACEEPRESCGLLVTLHEELYQLYWLPNLSDEPRISYFIDPEVVGYLVSEQEFYEKVWVWHTHPGGTVGPSKRDLETAVKGVHYCVITLPSMEVVTYQRHQ